MYRAIFRYAFYEAEPDLKGLEKGIFQMIRAQIDANNKRYEDGKKGGRPRKTGDNKPEEENKKTTGFENKNQRKESKKPNDNGTVNGNDTDTVNNNVGNSCSEQNKDDSAIPIISLILNDKTLYGVYQKDVDEWGVLYPAVDVMQELRNMKGWLDGNPTKRKTRSGVRRFIIHWLMKEQNKGGNGKVGANNGTTESQSSIDIWKQ